jgi:hypothetical protein
VRKRRIEGAIERILMEHTYSRLTQAIRVSSLSVLANSNLFNRIINLAEERDDDKEMEAQVTSLSGLKSTNEIDTFTDALVFATPHVYQGHLLVVLEEK